VTDHLQNYEFVGGYPTPETVRRAYDDADLNRAVSAYRFFYPTVSVVGTWEGNLAAGMVPNKVFGILEGTPAQLVFTPNSDTPYAGLVLDVGDAPMVMDLPPGPLMCAANDLNQRWVLDMGLPGPDAGNGGRHVICGPDFDGEIPDGYYHGRATTNRILVLLRALPRGADMAGAIAEMKKVKVYPLGSDPDSNPLEWVNLSEKVGADFTPLRWEDNLEYWRVLHDLIDREPPFDDYRAFYGELATLGIAKGEPFEPDERMRDILTNAARIGCAQLRVQSFADRRAEREVWPGTNWEWAVLRPENGTFDTPNLHDTTARQKWFFQAQIESPAMFRRTPGAGSLYWLGTRDATGDFLMGDHHYTLTVPQPVPGKLFWSITIYDALTRSEIRAEQNHAALRSLFELADAAGDESVSLHFSPTEPDGADGRWIQTLPGTGWFAYFRILGGPREMAETMARLEVVAIPRDREPVQRTIEQDLGLDLFG
jgi:hypothetical protein